MTIGVVVPCYRQERHLPRTIGAIEAALAACAGWRGVLVRAARAPEPAPALRSHWTVIEAAGPRPATPGAARMLGFDACGGDWVLFVDADFEVDPAWVEEALELAERRPELGGIWGRVEEWFEDTRGQRPGNLDMYGVGHDERTVKYAATVALYRRTALAAVGGYDPRLNSEEDFELGMRLRRAGFKLRSVGHRAGRHWSAPRPSFGEIGRRWRAGLFFGQGQVLRVYAGHRGFVTLLWRQRLYLATLALWALGVIAALVSLVRGDFRLVWGWALLPLALLALMALRKGSPKLAFHSLLSWTVLGLGLVVGWFRMPKGPHAPLSGGGAC